MRKTTAYISSHFHYHPRVPSLIYNTIISRDSERSTSPKKETPPTSNNLQDMMKRMQDSEANKRRFRLTEADCKLLLTNANELSFADGQIIGLEGDELTAAYRIKSGSVVLEKDGRTLVEMTEGWFFGESIFLNSTLSRLHVNVVAKGRVILAQMNIPFVQKLFEVDNVLAQKFYRNIAAKMAVTYQSLITTISQPLYTRSRAKSDCSVSTTVMSPPSPTLTSTSSSSSSSSSSLSALSLSNIPSPTPVRSPSPTEEMNFPRRKLSKRKTIQVANAPFKVYPLEATIGGTKTVSLSAHKLEIRLEAFGLKHKKRIEYANIKHFTKTSDSSITILAEAQTVQAETLFFKSKANMDEFLAIFTSLMEQLRCDSTRSHITSPVSSSPSSRHQIQEKFLHAPFRDAITQMGTSRTYKKGEVIVEEGDLVQRVYLINSGNVSTILHGFDINPLKEGDSFGIFTLLHLRSFPTSMVVTSETAEVVVIPAFKIYELISTNDELGAQIFLRAAVILSVQLDRLITFNRENGNLIF